MANSYYYQFMYEEENAKPFAHIIEVESWRDESRRRPREIRLFASVFLHISKNEAGDKQLDKVYLIIANPFDYPKKPSVANPEFVGENMLTDARNFIRSINEEYHLLKPIPDFCWQNLTNCVSKVSPDSSPRSCVEHEYLEWAKDYIREFEQKTV